MTDTKSIDAMIDDLDVQEMTEEAQQQKKCIAIWLPITYQQRYTELNSKTKRQFAETVKRIIKAAIDKAS
jgi:hypothetical protein